MSRSITIYGASDDLIEVEGAINEEFGAFRIAEGDGVLMGVSDGTLLRIRYDGCWRIAREKAGSAAFAKVEGDPDDDYTDRVTLTGDAIAWVVMGKNWARLDSPPLPPPEADLSTVESEG